MIRKTAMIILLAGLLAGLPVAAQQTSEPITRVKVGDEAPDFRLRAHTGDWFQLSDYRGKVVLLYFWMEF